jgi:hypothetical protein
MQKEDLTKIDLLDIAIEMHESIPTLFSLLNIILRIRPTVFPFKFTLEDIVEPHIFFDLLEEAAQNSIETTNFIQPKTAKAILDVLLHEDLNKMPLHINDPLIGCLAIWRLKKGI